VIQACQPQKGQVMWDLGCGAGRPLLTAALAFPDVFEKVRGVELLEDLTNLAQLCIDKIPSEVACAEIEVI
jgi:tRNA/tmRNA/rRNA uracil-C5-methylase (TrmA/RlmC/RlmD family)